MNGHTPSLTKPFKEFLDKPFYIDMFPLDKSEATQILLQGDNKENEIEFLMKLDPSDWYVPWFITYLDLETILSLSPEASLISLLSSVKANRSLLDLEKVLLEWCELNINFNRRKWEIIENKFQYNEHPTDRLKSELHESIFDFRHPVFD